jgi:hypothetical protein
MRSDCISYSYVGCHTRNTLAMVIQVASFDQVVKFAMVVFDHAAKIQMIVVDLFVMYLISIDTF